MTESGAIVAEFGEVAAALRASFGIPTPVFAAVVSLDAVGAAASTPLRYQALPRFPAVERDLAFVIGSDQTLTAAQIESALREEAGPLLRRLVLFDVFRFPDGRSSLAWRLLFQAEDRTLDRRRSERDPGASGPADHRDFPRHPAERLMGDGIVERLTELEGAVKRAAESLARMREENAQLKREVKRLGDERRQVLAQVDMILKDIGKLDLDRPQE